MKSATAIDFRTMPVNVPSLCIPRVYTNISEGRIRKIFDELNIGVIDHIDMINKNTEKGEKYNRVFIHMSRWFTDGNAAIARERLLNGKDIKIIYDDPWFWKVSAYREANKSDNRQPLKKPTIQFDTDEDVRPQRQFKDTDIKPLTVPRPRPVSKPQNNDGFKKGKKEVTYETSRRPPEPVTVKVDPVKVEPIKVEPVPVKILQSKFHLDSNIEQPSPAVVYDMNVVNSTKKRVIKIKKNEPNGSDK